MYIILANTVEEIMFERNKWISIIILTLAFIILVSIAVDRLLNKFYKLERPKDVEGYIKGGYVNRPHQIGGVLLQILIAIVPAFFVFQENAQLGLIDFLVILLFVALTFDAFMQWRYPIQRNEYKKTISMICILLVIIPILYQLIPADLLAK